MSTKLIVLNDREIEALAAYLGTTFHLGQADRAKGFIDALNKLRVIPVGTVRVDDHGNTAVLTEAGEWDDEPWLLVRPDGEYEWVTYGFVEDWPTVYKPKAAK